MRMPDLVAVSGYPGMKAVIEEASSIIGIEPVIIDWEFANQGLVDLLRERFSLGGEPAVIISRGASANLIQGSFPNMLVLRAEPDNVDILEALEEARLYGNRIGLLLHSSVSHSCKPETIRRIMQLKELRVYTFDTAQDIRQRIAEGKADGMRAMVGGGTLGAKTGRETGIPTFPAATGPLAMERVLRQAMSIIELSRRNRLQLETFHAMAALLPEGVMIIEGNRTVLVNDELLRILDTDDGQIAGRHLQEVPEDVFGREILEFFHDGSAREAVLSIRGKNYLVRKSGTPDTRLAVAFCGAEEIRQQEQKIHSALRAAGMKAKFTFRDITGDSEAIRSAKEKALFYAATDANILIYGESGTGKELFAQSIHSASPRAMKPFVAVNCAAIPETLLESELFGYEEGAFSGAKRGGHRGLFEAAHGGTLFLDEIDSIPVHLQGVLLRAIQEKEIRRVGSRRTFSVDVRIISATNRNIKKMIAGGAFREDLYYRLNILNIQIPSLEERREDILPLAEQFLIRYAQKYQKTAPVLTQEDQQVLMEAKWSGNVRALENVIHRFSILCGKQPVSVRDCLTDPLSAAHRAAVPTPMSAAGPETGGIEVPLSSLENMERALIQACLQRCHGNQTAAAAQLGISRTTLWKKLKAADRRP